MTCCTITLTKQCDTRYNPVNFVITIDKKIDERNFSILKEIVKIEDNKISIETYHFKNCIDYLKEIYKIVILNNNCKKILFSIVILKIIYDKQNIDTEKIIEEIINKIKRTLSAGFSVNIIKNYNKEKDVIEYIALLEYDITCIKFYSELEFKHLFDKFYEIFTHERDRISILLRKYLNELHLNTENKIKKIEVQGVLSNSYKKYNLERLM